MYNDRIEDSKSATHLGIVRNVTGKPDIEEKISLGRKTAYSLMWQVFMGEGVEIIAKRVYLVYLCSSEAALWS